MPNCETTAVDVPWETPEDDAVSEEIIPLPLLPPPL